MASEEYKIKKLAYIKQYQQKHYAKVSFTIRLDKDQDILDILNSVPNKSEFIKKLIRVQNKAEACSVHIVKDKHKKEASN